MELKWENPPGGLRGRKQDWFTDQTRDALRARPGQWALIATGIRSGSVSYQRNKHGGEFEITARNIDQATTKGDVYARFIGGAA